MNFSQGREKYGAVRAGQIWMKADVKRCMTVIARQGDNTWRVAFDNKTRKSSHKVKERDIYKFYIRVR
jgi:hypothetical protein